MFPFFHQNGLWLLPPCHSHFLHLSFLHFQSPGTPGGRAKGISPFCGFGKRGSRKCSHLLVAQREEASGTFWEVWFLCVFPYLVLSGRFNKYKDVTKITHTHTHTRAYTQIARQV